MIINFCHSTKAYVATGASSEEAIALKKAGFFFNPIYKDYRTNKLKIAARFQNSFSESVKTKINSVSTIENTWAGRIVEPSNGLQLEGYQREAVNFALTRNYSYLGLEQGLGKTPIGIVIVNSIMRRYFGLSRVLVVVPPFLVSNWLREFERWREGDYLILAIRTGKEVTSFDGHIGVTILPDSHLSTKVYQKLLQFNYDAIIVDEGHRFNAEERRGKNKSRRSVHFLEEYGLSFSADKVILLSGTFIRNRPIEFYPILERFAHNLIEFMDFYSYGLRYCDGRYVSIGHRNQKRYLDVSGASNLKELRKKLKPFLLVERAKDHLDLKSKENIILLDGKKNKHIGTLERSILKRRSIEDLVGDDCGLGELATYRKELSELKLGPSISYLKNILEFSDESILAFAWHNNFILDLQNSLKKYNPLVIYGGVNNKSRDSIEARIQGGESRLLIANIQTMVGLNLTKCTRGVFLESSWVPADNDQAKKRMIRRGQESEVLIEHLVLADTLDEYVLRRVLEKQDTINEMIGE